MSSVLVRRIDTKTNIPLNPVKMKLLSLFIWKVFFKGDEKLTETRTENYFLCETR